MQSASPGKLKQYFAILRGPEHGGLGIGVGIIFVNQNAQYTFPIFLGVSQF